MPAICPDCKGHDFYLLVDEAHPSGAVRPCPRCHDFLSRSRLNVAEQQTKVGDIRGTGSATVLRVAAQAIMGDPWGFFTVWGEPGSAKSLLLFAVVAGLCKKGVKALYYHAGDLQQALYRDIQNEDSDYLGAFMHAPALAIDELDKFNMTDWSLKRLQTLLDYRYRSSIGRHDNLTLFASNRDPAAVEAGKAWLPDDILSRLRDGRFNRPVDAVGLPAELKETIPAIYHVVAPDMRPQLKRKKT